MIEVVRVSVSTTSAYTLLYMEHKSKCAWRLKGTDTLGMIHAHGDRHLLQHATHTHVTYRTQTCKSQKHAQPRGRLHRVHGPCESSSEIPRAHRGCLVLPARDARSFCGGTFSSRINEKLHLSHEKSIFTIYLTSCIPKAHIRRC